VGQSSAVAGDVVEGETEVGVVADVEVEIEVVEGETEAAVEVEDAGRVVVEEPPLPQAASANTSAAPHNATEARGTRRA
jgi:hypothetical protein